MKRYRSLYCILAVGLCSALSFGLSGSGTAEDPCLIQSLDDFDEFRSDSAFWDKHIRLEAELDFTSRIYYSALIESFEGVFDGNHQPIRNLRIDGGLREYVGFFGSCYSAEIRNMNFITPNVSAYKQVAVLCGYSESSIIRDCTITDMTLFVHQYAGGIIGKDYGSTVTFCEVSGEVTGYEDYGTESRNLGGLIGYTYEFTVVEDCHTQITFKKYMTSHKMNSVGGLIGNLGQGGARRSSSICTITGNNYLGGLLGESIRPTNVVEDCFAEANISGSDCIGGLIGRNGNANTSSNGGGEVIRCSSNASLHCVSNGGGLVGMNYTGPVRQCRSVATISSGSSVGGLIGYTDGPIHSCSASSTITGSSFVGGLTGTGNGQIQLCSSDSTLSGSSYVGGIMGSGNGQVQDCYAIGSLTCTGQYFGGLIGTTAGTIDRCFVAVVLTGASSTYRGALIGRLELAGKASSCFWNSEIQTIVGIKDIGNKKGTATDIYAKTTAEMMTQSTFTAFGWDFTNETTNGVADLWRLCTDGTSYPRLSWEFPRQDLACPDGVGIEDLLVLSAQWLASGLTPNTGPDFTGDGNILLDDLASFSSAWLTTP